MTENTDNKPAYRVLAATSSPDNLERELNRLSGQGYVVAPGTGLSNYVVMISQDAQAQQAASLAMATMQQALPATKDMIEKMEKEGLNL